MIQADLGVQLGDGTTQRANAAPALTIPSEETERMATSQNTTKKRRRAPRNCEYGIWFNMLRRCEDHADRRYASYGGRGIRVCERWHDFKSFLADIGRRPSPDYSLDRIDNDGNYEPSNCRWATRDQQIRNTRRSHPVTVDGVTKNLIDWARESGISHPTLYRRLASGWTPEQAISIPPKCSNRLDGYLVGEDHPLSKLSQEQAQEIRDAAGRVPRRELSERFGVSRNTIRAIQIGAVWKRLKVREALELEGLTEGA
jgi:hypothetical protein